MPSACTRIAAWLLFVLVAGLLLAGIVWTCERNLNLLNVGLERCVTPNLKKPA
jgi:hypothetical protein